MDPLIRPADPGEADGLTSLAHRAKASWGYPAAWLAAWQAELTLTPSYVAAHRVFVAEAERRVVGVCALEDHGDRWALEHVWIDPSAQRQGIGTALVRHALRAVAAIRPGTVTVVSDPQAADFYRDLGAVPVGDEPAPMAGAPDRTLPVFRFVVGGA